jgi:hypothetical protein
MSPDRAFRIPRAHKDRVKPRKLMAIALTCLSVGVALSGAMRAPERARPESVDPSWQSAGVVAPAVQTVETVIQAATALAPLVADSSEDAPPAPHQVEPPAPHEVEPPAPKKPGGSAKPKLLRGAIAYRCGGPSPGTCPKDRVLEARIWRVLSRVATCRNALDEASGHAQLRLWFAPGAATRALIGAPTISPSLNLRAVSQCVERDLSKLRATRKSDRIELSVVFGLAPRN